MCSRSRRRLTYCSSDSPRAPGRAPESASAACTMTASTVCGSASLWWGSTPRGVDFVVVGFPRVGDGFGFAVATGELAADEGVRAFDLVRDRLADVVQERRSASGLW